LKASGLDGPYIIEREISDAASEAQIAKTLQSIRKMVL
jgi:hypothetical protein